MRRPVVHRLRQLTGAVPNTFYDVQVVLTATTTGEPEKITGLDGMTKFQHTYTLCVYLQKYIGNSRYRTYFSASEAKPTLLDFILC